MWNKPYRKYPFSLAIVARNNTQADAAFHSCIFFINLACDLWNIPSDQRLDCSHAIVSAGSSKHVRASGLLCCKQVGRARARRKGL